MDQGDIFPEQLKSHVGSSIDQDGSLIQSNCDRTARSIVFRICAEADIAITAQGRNAYTGSRSQQYHLSVVGSQFTHEILGC